MKRVQQKVHSAFSPRRQRMFLIAAGIALQFAIYVVLLVLFSQYFVYFYWICVLVSLVMALFISTWKSKLAYKIACSSSSRKLGKKDAPEEKYAVSVLV